MSRGSRRLLAELQVASLLIYPSRPQSAADREARDVILTGIKQAKPRHLQRVAERLSDLPEDHSVRQLVPSNTVLVPVPRSTPLRDGALWPALDIAKALVSAGVGALALPLLVRDEPVRRSAGARSLADREPPLRHYETVSAVISQLGLEDPTAHYVLVDDVVTTGSTLIACASHLAAIAPKASVAALAVARAERSKTFTASSEMYSPTVEVVRLSADDGRPWRS